MEAIPGYLSLHQTADVMTLKWTPNQLMNGNVGELDSEKRFGTWNPINKKTLLLLHCLLHGSFFLLLLAVFIGIMP